MTATNRTISLVLVSVVGLAVAAGCIAVIVTKLGTSDEYGRSTPGTQPARSPAAKKEIGRKEFDRIQDKALQLTRREIGSQGPAVVPIEDIRERIQGNVLDIDFEAAFERHLKRLMDQEYGPGVKYNPDLP